MAFLSSSPEAGDASKEVPWPSSIRAFISTRPCRATATLQLVPAPCSLALTLVQQLPARHLEHTTLAPSYFSPNCLLDQLSFETSSPFLYLVQMDSSSTPSAGRTCKWNRRKIRSRRSRCAKSDLISIFYVLFCLGFLIEMREFCFSPTMPQCGRGGALYLGTRKTALSATPISDPRSHEAKEG